MLGWHNIDPTPGFPDPPGVGRLGFAKQLRTLARFANVLPLDEALRLMEAGEPLPPRAVVLTFDDGYRDNLDLGVPMLAEHGFPATFFLVPGFLSGTVGAWWEDLSAAFERARAPRLTVGGVTHDLSSRAARQAAHDAVRASVKTLDHAARVAEVARVSEELNPASTSVGEGLFMDWSGAKSLLAAGHEIGSHTVSHAILERETEAGQLTELAESRSALESGLGDLGGHPRVPQRRGVGLLGDDDAAGVGAGLPVRGDDAGRAGRPVGLALRDAAGGAHADDGPAERGVEGLAQGADAGGSAGVVAGARLRSPSRPYASEASLLAPDGRKAPSSTPDQARRGEIGTPRDPARGSASPPDARRGRRGAGRPGRCAIRLGRMPSTWRPAER